MARKITIIGAAGRSGHDTALEIANRTLLKTGDEIVLVDINERASGIIGELKTAYERKHELPKITAVNALKFDDLDAIKNSDIIIMCASVPFPRGGFKSRDWGLFKNEEINSRYAAIIGEKAPDAKVIMDTNPVDVLTARFREESGLGAHQVIGKGGDLDTQRLRSVLARAIAKKMSDPSAEISAYKELEALGHDMCMAGVHSVESMVAVVNHKAMVQGKTIDEWFSETEYNRLIDIAKDVGPKSSRQLEVGSPSAGAALVNCDLIEKLYSDTPQEAMVSVPLTGLYGLGETPAYACTPTMLSKRGIENITELPLINEKPALKAKLVSGVRGVEDRLNRIPIYQELRQFIGSTPPLDALVDNDGRIIIAPKTAGMVSKDQLLEFYDTFRKLLQQPDSASLEQASGEHIQFYYPYPDEAAALMDTIHLDPVRNIMSRIETTRADLERLTDLAFRHHPKGADAQRWQDRTSIPTHPGGGHTGRAGGGK